MMCTPRSAHRQPEVGAVVSAPDPHARIGDADRERTAALLGDAAGAGYLTIEELDERLSSVWSASSAAELSAVASDLPAELRRERARREVAARARDAARAGLPAHLASYAGVMLLLVAIWLVVGLTAGSWYPWPIWPAIGWGIGVAGHVRAARVPSTGRP